MLITSGVGVICVAPKTITMRIHYSSSCIFYAYMQITLLFKVNIQERMHADAKRCHGIGGQKFGIGRLRENFPGFSRKTLKVWLVPLPMSFFSSPQLRHSLNIGIGLN